MRKKFIIFPIALSLFLTSCGSDTTSKRYDELSQKYEYYPESIKNIKKNMDVTPEQADEIFLTLIDCGISNTITRITKDSDNTFSVWISLNEYTVSLEDGVISKVIDNNFLGKDEQLYPVLDKSKEKPFPTEKPKLSSLQLISMEKHPVLYDYISKAHKFWDDYADGRILFDDDYRYQQGKTALVINTYGILEHDLKEHMIRSFEIYPNKKIKLKNGLKIAKSYLPLDIMKKWYYLEDSTYYYTKENKQCYYSALFEPTKKGKKEIKKLGLDYNYVAVFIETKNNIIEFIDIDSVYNVPRGLDYDKKKKWSYDFLK